MKLKKMIPYLCEQQGISGFEHCFSQKVEALLEEFCDEVYTDPMGSVHGILRCGKMGAKRLLLDAHMDEIGLMVTEVTKEGFVRFTNIGGVDSRILPGLKVTVHGKEPLFGVISIKPPHIQTLADMKKAIPMKDMVIDIGYTQEQAKELVSPGDMITFRAQAQELLGGRLASKTLDDRAGVAVIISAAQKLSRKERNVDIEVLVSAQEETGLRGAKVGSYRSGADMALVVDVSHAKTPDASGDNVYEMEGGAMIAMGPNMDRAMAKQLVELAKEKEIPYQIEVMGGDTGTNAWVIQVSGQGIPCGLLSIPQRYMHTTIESISLKDAKAVRDLMVAYARSLEEKEEQPCSIC